MSCQYCSGEKYPQRAKIHMESCIKRGTGYEETTTVRVDAESKQPRLVLDSLYGYENTGDSVTGISMEIRYCPYCGEKLV